MHTAAFFYHYDLGKRWTCAFQDHMSRLQTVFFSVSVGRGEAFPRNILQQMSCTVESTQYYFTYLCTAAQLQICWGHPTYWNGLRTSQKVQPFGDMKSYNLHHQRFCMAGAPYPVLLVSLKSNNILTLSWCSSCVLNVAVKRFYYLWINLKSHPVG